MPTGSTLFVKKLQIFLSTAWTPHVSMTFKKFKVIHNFHFCKGSYFYWWLFPNWFHIGGLDAKDNVLPVVHYLKKVIKFTTAGYLSLLEFCIFFWWNDLEVTQILCPGNIETSRSTGPHLERFSWKKIKNAKKVNFSRLYSAGWLAYRLFWAKPL